VRTADQIRSAFLTYFAERGHRVVRSSPLLPANDPSLLFANAGMNQFKDVFLGREKREYTRAASSQKCVRAGGKHNDLENVGVTARHHTFFEMLGNFSFGDYFKQEAIAYAWEFLTLELGLDPARLTVTVFKGEGGVPRDAQAHGFWTAHVPAERILELGLKDNFWAMGETGPCGPCSEVHYFQGDALPCAEAAAGRPCRGVECECDRWLEIWNLVFMQYERSGDGAMTPLPAPCVDTGMGLERVAAVVQGKLSNYDSDLFAPLLQAVAARAGRAYGSDAAADVSMRVIADHVRAATFLVGDGILPSNEGRGYVLRKIMRRALLHARKLGLEGPRLAPLTADVVERMKGAYPELVSQARSIARVTEVEEGRFVALLKNAIPTAERAFTHWSQKHPAGGAPPLPGAEAFRLYDTFGLPLDLVEDLAREHGLDVDRAGFDREMEAQRERARQSSKLGAVKGDPVFLKLREQGPTRFLGYDSLVADEARVLAVLKDGQLASRLEAGEQGGIVLDATPFYGEAGGQVGDRGVISAGGATAEVLDATVPVPGLYLHHVRVDAGGFEKGMAVRAEVDARRRAATMRHHTGTHLLHAALRDALGTHVKQAGSLVAPDRLRFDFSHYAGVDAPQLRQIENQVNEQILRDTAVEGKVMGREEALAYGALAFFGDKYGEQVRVIEVPGFSKEFCGGTHVGRTGEIGLFLVTTEQGISAGTRRVEALTGEAAVERAQRDQGILEELEEAAKTDRRALVDEYAKLREQLKARDRELQTLKRKLATAGGAGGDRASDAVDVAGVQVWTPRFEGLDKKAHAAVVDEFRNKNRDRAFVLLSSSVEGDGVHVISAVSSGLTERLKAPEIMKRLGLRGGGRPDFAQGGGVAPADLDALRGKAAEVLSQMLEGPGAA
jgi:alanyl-tRNA synthetase